MVQRTKSRLGADAPAVGFLVDLLKDGYQSAIAAGVLKAANDAGATVHGFAGGVLGPQSKGLCSAITCMSRQVKRLSTPW